MTPSTVPTPPWIHDTPIPNRRRHQVVFTAAGIYNIAWGLFTVAYPQWLFDFAGMAPANHPQAFATLGMVIGLYAVLYLSIALYPEHGWLCAAVGLTGKILGPIGLAHLLVTGTWPPATVIICLTNDIIWWIPFAGYLRDARPTTRHEVASHAASARSAPAASAGGQHPQNVAGLQLDRALVR